MPDLKILLRDVAEKFPEITPYSIGIQYKDLKHGSHYAFKSAPPGGELLDKEGLRRDHIIEIDYNMEHADNLVKVGVIAHCLSSISHYIGETVETGLLNQILQALTEDKLGYSDQSWEETSRDSEQRGFGRPLRSLDKYIREVR